MAYKFARNGSCEYYDLSPDDAHDWKPCRWTVLEHDGAVLRISADGTTSSFRIAELTGSVLRLEPLEAQQSAGAATNPAQVE
jgi:hypothetical protein